MFRNLKKNCLLFVCFFQMAIVCNAQQISGNVFIDKDGSTDNNINTSAAANNPATNINGTLFANLLNGSNLAVATVMINASGSYSFNNIPLGAYRVQLSTASNVGTYANPALAPAVILPTGWVNTGENIGNTNGNDGSVNGISSIINIAVGSMVTDVNFGIERLPETANINLFILPPVNEQIIPLNNAYDFMVWSGPYPNGFYYSRAFLGNDAEDMPIVGELTGKTIRIDTLINSLTPYPPYYIAQFDLLYSGVLVTAGQVIASYNPALMRIRCLTNYNLIDWGGDFQFKYSYIDAAGKADPTPATFRILFPVAGPLPISLSDFSVSKSNCNAHLNWKTVSEINADKFEIEYNNTGNAIFKVLGEKMAVGNSSTFTSYQFNYAMQSGKDYFFRLKMYQKDGSFTYSEIKKLSCTNTNTDISILPNRTSSLFHITGMNTGKNVLAIFSAEGKLLKTLTVLNNKDIDITNLQRGVYILKIMNENGVVSTGKILKD